MVLKCRAVYNILRLIWAWKTNSNSAVYNRKAIRIQEFSKKEAAGPDRQTSFRKIDIACYSFQQKNSRYNRKRGAIFM